MRKKFQQKLRNISHQWNDDLQVLAIISVLNVLAGMFLLWHRSIILNLFKFKKLQYFDLAPPLIICGGLTTHCGEQTVVQYLGWCQYHNDCLRTRCKQRTLCDSGSLF